MANCSIPSSTPATGRILTISSRRSKKLSKRARFDLSLARRCALRFQKRRRAAAVQSALRARKILRWILDVLPSTFSSSGRVKGAWWPSRSSKPSPPREWRGRFDSYPLRHFKFDGRCLRLDLFFSAKISRQTSTLKPQTCKEGGDLDVA